MNCAQPNRSASFLLPERDAVFCMERDVSECKENHVFTPSESEKHLLVHSINKLIFTLRGVSASSLLQIICIYSDNCKLTHISACCIPGIQTCGAFTLPRGATDSDRKNSSVSTITSLTQRSLTQIRNCVIEIFFFTEHAA